MTSPLGVARFRAALREDVTVGELSLSAHLVSFGQRLEGDTYGDPRFPSRHCFDHFFLYDLRTRNPESKFDSLVLS